MCQLGMSVARPFKRLPFHAGETVSPLLRLLRPSHSHGSLSSRGERREWCGLPSYIVDTPDQSWSLPLEIDLSLVNSPGTQPEHLVDAVRSLRPFLPVGCELLGQEDLKLVGSHPIDAGGFADVWVGEKNNGATVAIKSLRHYSSSSCVPIYLVSGERYCNAFSSLKVFGRGCTRKH